MIVTLHAYLESEISIKRESIALFKILLCLSICIWALRLFLFLALRAWGKGEDTRYTDFRHRFGAERYWWFSLFQVFWLQACLAWLISLPIQMAMKYDGVFNRFLCIIGMALFIFGLVYESYADHQLAQFKKDKAAGRVTSRVFRQGLWRYSRHPNYFGECVLWWGLWVFMLQASLPWWSIFSPLMMTWLLLKVSGVALLDEHQVKRKPEYQDYINSTPAFIPSWLTRFFGR